MHGLFLKKWLYPSNISKRSCKWHLVDWKRPTHIHGIFLVLVGNDPGVSHLGGEIVSHNTMDARRAGESMRTLPRPGPCRSLQIPLVSRWSSTPWAAFRAKHYLSHNRWALNKTVRLWNNNMAFIMHGLFLKNDYTLLISASVAANGI